MAKDSQRPIIAVTGPDRGGFPAWIFTALAVWRAGGRPRRVSPKRVRDPAALVFAGLIVGGGADVDPESYRDLLDERPEDPPVSSAGKRERGRLASLLLAPLLFLLRRFFSLRATGIDRDRDELESVLLRRAFTEGRPVLGICRGMQLINVAWGGSLHGDISEFYAEVGKFTTVMPRKPVSVEPDSKLAAILDANQVFVNSLHDQAIDRVGRGLVVSGRDHAEVIQAIERQGPGFCIGVQWHPEYLPSIPRQQFLFHALIREARGGEEK